MTTVVATQEELDAAVEGGAEHIVIDSPPSVQLELRDSPRVEVRGSSYVLAWGSSYVESWDSSQVEAFELSYVVAHGSSYVESWDSSQVEAFELSYVVALERSYVQAWDCSRVDAWGWSYVQAWDRSRVVASPWVAVRRHSTAATVIGGTVIDMTNVDLSDSDTWAAHHGVATKDGTATVYKAVSRELVAGQGHIPTTYTIGSTVDATDWDPTARCGGGLHFSPTPSQARFYYQGDGKPRLLACEVDIAPLVPMGDQCKAPRCRVLHEVDRLGDPVAGAGVDDEQETTP